MARCDTKCAPETAAEMALIGKARLGCHGGDRLPDPQQMSRLVQPFRQSENLRGDAELFSEPAREALADHPGEASPFADRFP